MSDKDEHGSSVSRRRFLKITAAGTAAAALPWSLSGCLDGATAAGGAAIAPKASPLVDKFRDPLPRPYAIRPGNGSTVSLALRQVRQEVHSQIGPVTTVWAYGNQQTGYSTPGPTLDIRKPAGGRFDLDVRWMNRLAADPNAPHFFEIHPSVLAGVANATNNRKAVVHLHGGKITAEADGFPTDTRLPNGDHLFHYGIVQDPATLWYHDHAIGNTRLNVMMGLAGLFLVRDSYELGLIENTAGLPSYAHEIPIVLQDRRINRKGQLSYDSRYDDSFFGDVMVVNGKAWPYLDVERRQYRLRLLNGSNSRAYTLHFGDNSTHLAFYQIGTDLGFLNSPVRLTEITLTPGERADIVIDFAQTAGGDDVYLINTNHMGSEHTDVPTLHEVMKFRVQYVSVSDPVVLPAVLRASPLLPFDVAGATERDFTFEDHYVDIVGDSEWLINGKMFEDPVEEVVQNGSVEVWNWVNKSEMMHPMHIHLAQSQIIGRYEIVEDEDGKLVPGRSLGVADYEKGMKDTVNVGPREIVKVASKFDGQANKLPGQSEVFPFHCHILEHEDFDMMRPFQLVY